MKDYKKWHPLKKNLNNKKGEFLHFHVREVWYCHLGENIGFEQDGRGDEYLRPIVILKKFNNDLLWGIPLTKSGQRKDSKSDKYYYEFSFIKEIDSRAILSQIRSLDAKRLVRHIGTISEENFRDLTKKFKALLP